MLQSAREGHPFDVDSNPLIRLAGIGISLLVGCLAAFVIAVWVSDRMMKSVSAKTEAGAYLTAGSVVITGREDYFTHTTETRTKIEKSSGSGGTTVDSDGFSGKAANFNQRIQEDSDMKRTTKQAISLLLALCMILALAGCGKRQGRALPLPVRAAPAKRREQLPRSLSCRSLRRM